MKESDIKYDEQTKMWFICTPLGVCMYFRRREDAVRTMDEFAPPAEHKLFRNKELVKVCCESHGGPVGLHCNHDHCTGPVLVCPECHLPDPDHKMDCSKNR